MTLWLSTAAQLAPELAVLVTLLWVFLSDLFLSRNARGLWIQTLLGLTGATFAAAMLYQVDTPAGGLQEQFRWVLSISPLTSALKTVVLMLAALAVAFSFGAFQEAKQHAGEFYCLILFSTLGALFCVSSQDLVLFFLAFELLSLPLYMLCAFRRYHSASAEAGLKYFINGALSSALMLFGISWIYGSLGTTNLVVASERYLQLPHVPHGLLVGLVLMLVGIAFKVSAAPFHNWAPDVYTGAPSSVSAFLASAPKVAMVGFALRFFWGHFDSVQGTFRLSADWVLIFLVLSSLSMFVGNLSALPQVDVRKILAYSGIAQIGYLIMGLASCSESNRHPDQALMAVLYYALVYGLANLGAWAVLGFVERSGQTPTLESLQGLHQRAPLVAVSLAVCLMSLAGVPPLAGFVGKFYLFRAIYHNGLPFMVVLAILNSVISLFYYFKVLKAAFFVEREESRPAAELSAIEQLAFHIVLWSNLALGLWPGVMVEFERLAKTLTQGN